MLNKIILIFLIFALLYLVAFKPIHSVQNSAIQSEANRFRQSLVFDKNGVPSYNYSQTGHTSVGIQGSPHAVATNALRLYNDYVKNSNESARTYFINNVNWLVNTKMLKNNGSFSTYEFSFPWPIGNYTIQAPWRNAMVDGEALDPLAKAFHITGNKTYIETAKKILNSFYVEVKDGGVAYKTPNSGWFYEEYASKNSTKEPRVLNGMIHALFGISEYYNDTNDTSAKFILNQGILALKNDLPKYDNNGLSYYDRLGLPANSFYKSLHVTQLKKLFELTNDPIFKTYYNKWNEYNLTGKSK
jgi:heparosan-N-sulfate-glucuronate 5-epimerase